MILKLYRSVIKNNLGIFCNRKIHTSISYRNSKHLLDRHFQYNNASFLLTQKLPIEVVLEEGVLECAYLIVFPTLWIYSNLRSTTKKILWIIRSHVNTFWHFSYVPWTTNYFQKRLFASFTSSSSICQFYLSLCSILFSAIKLT